MIKMEYSMKMLLWDEFNPNVYELFGANRIKKQTRKELILVVEFKVNGSRFAVNGRRFSQRTLSAPFSKDGYPPTDPNIGKDFRCGKAGLNHVRFHSWCPPERF